VSIVTIKGTNTALELIANVAVQTKGYNDVVDPLKLTKNFNFILQNNIIATDVTVQMFLHKSLRFKHEETSKDLSKCLRDVGNVNKESTITFEYIINDKEKAKEIKQLPFQIQIRFTKLNGAKCLRVLSKVTQVTENREEAEKHVNVGVIGIHAQLQAAKLAADGSYTKARMVQKSNMRMVRRALKSPESTEQQQKQYRLWSEEAVRLNDAIKTGYVEEEQMGLEYGSACDDHSDIEIDNHIVVVEIDKKEKKEKEDEKKDEKDEEEKEEKEEKEKVERKKKKEARKKERKVRRAQTDTLSNALYQAQNPLYTAFTEQANPLYHDDDE